LKAIAQSSPSWRTAIAWLALAAYLAIVIRYAGEPTRFAQLLAAILIAGAFVHAGLSYGWKNALVLFLLCLAITFAIENLGAATGFPFRHYHFAVDPGLPHIGAIPLIVGPLWFGMGYFSWIVAATLLDGADRRLDRDRNALVLPIVAAFVVTQWDLAMDPPAATIFKIWVWHDGGGDFGVPLSNYLGWLLTAWLFYQAFAIYLRRRAGGRTQRIGTGRAFRLAAILVYAAGGLCYLVPWLMGGGGEVTDAAGHVWHVADLRETTVIVVIFTMGFTSLLAILRLARADSRFT
jgi:uncharacterized membrane protein